MSSLRLIFLVVFILQVQVIGAAITYQPDYGDFPNPERGFYVQSMNREIRRPTPRELTVETLRHFREENKVSLLRYYFRLDEWKAVPIPQSYLDEIGAIIDTVRQAGFKIIPRFSYNWGGDDTDASLEQIQSHIDQVGPILAKNAEVMAFMEAGFIGMYGEWHHWGGEDIHNLDNAESRRGVLFKLLDALPKERMVVLRYAHWKRQVYDTDEPLSLAEAFDESNRSRTGALNDCVGVDIHNGGTYLNSSDSTFLQWQKDYLNQDNRYVPQGGETCGESQYSACGPMLEDFERMRWDVINMGYHPGAVQSWRDGGCYEEISRSLGYRLNLVSAVLADSVRQGGIFTGYLRITNTGWGKVYNPRPVQLVFRSVSSGQEFKVPVHSFRDPSADPRYWLKGDTAALSINAAIPTTAQGPWQVYLNLPDPDTSFGLLPDYSIRLANQDMWESSTGYNDLKHTVILSSNISGMEQKPAAAPVVFKGARQIGNLIRFKLVLPAEGEYKLALFDITGSQIWKTETQINNPGAHSFEFVPEELKSGIYILELKSTSLQNQVRFTVPLLP